MKTASADPPPRRGGRPSRARAGQLRDRIVDSAAHLFLTQGYGATSVEAVAKRAGVSKRTFYHRFADKAELFGAVVQRLIASLRPANAVPLFTGGTLEEILQRLGKVILRAALTPEALALHRLMVSEAVRFPELGIIMDTEGSRREAVKHIAALLAQQPRPGNLMPDAALFAAEQFLQMMVSLPQRRALGLGTPMNPARLDAWVADTVRFFLDGYHGGLPRQA
ncbi:MAG: TetR/AcrR family transcriptional regulator [Alphaproteobacteria bacterium]|nr:TetR/AcrR family transcriptional regulator [Alphaproteobacteria bacterium]